jgi:hypothetical protein
MTVVTWPLSSGEARGRTGGLIYNTRRGISYVKTHAVHQSEFTDPQIQVRATTALCTARWQSLPQPVRDLWDHFANEHTLDSWTGQPKRISGYNWFIKLNWWTQTLLGTITDYPPDHLPAYLFADLTSTWSTPDILTTWTPQTTGPTPTWSVLSWIQGPHSPGRKPSIKLAHFGDVAAEFDAGMPTAIATPGTYTIWLQTLHISGCRMPPQPFTLDCT